MFLLFTYISYELNGANDLSNCLVSPVKSALRNFCVIDWLDVEGFFYSIFEHFSPDFITE